MGKLVKRGRGAALRIIEAVRTRLARDTSADPYHANFANFVALTDQRNPAGKVLEIGSRNVTGELYKNRFRNYSEYIGFDIHPGENVDKVGDVHSLSAYFNRGDFDFVYMISVLEHVAMPWKAIIEINKVMKTGGSLFIATHPTWPPHALPWDFWRFNEAAFKVLLNKLTGFEIVQCNEGLPCAIVPYGREPSMTDMWRQRAYLGISVIASKIAEPDPRLLWDVDLDEIIDSMYPAASQPIL